ncbi:MAG: hypothetical protein HN725_00725 [Alphaproteobacteria bacterium]|nr:hypothetical protein [Alphaproteobacteria bacterium]MBT4083279.1 hypothetical protein [Alphaproteobacteria bacterium]MBT4544225.1 hypothetical protein [Alphaproteobacteria bacterium]MBT7743782.1 hypothetical protein [Alphaproteobacteria bacterium]
MPDTPRVIEEILENIIQGVVMFDNERRLVVWNQQYESILNYPENFLHVGLSHYDMALFFAKRGDLGKGDVEQIARDRVEFFWSGQEKQAEITISGNRTFELLYGKSSDNGLVETYTDITERKKMETSIRDSEARFKGYVDIAADWYWETDADSRFTYFSENVLGGDATIKTSDLIGVKRLDRIDLAKLTPAEKAQHFADFN